MKTLTHGEKLTGAYFGYVMELAWNMAFFADQGTIAWAEVSTQQASGHLGLHQALHSPDIDFFVSPYRYAFRGLGGDGLPMQPAEALRHHGKIYVMERGGADAQRHGPGWAQPQPGEHHRRLPAQLCPGDYVCPRGDLV